MTDKDKFADFEECLEQVSGGKIMDHANTKIDALIKRAKTYNYTKEEFLEQLPELVVDLKITDGNNPDEDMQRIRAYVNFRWDRL